MGISQTTYPTEGSSALKSVPGNRRSATIIAFPGAGQTASRTRRPAPEPELRRHSARQAVRDSELVTNLREGSLRGQAVGGITRLQSVAVGLLFAGAAFGALVLGL